MDEGPAAVGLPDLNPTMVNVPQGIVRRHGDANELYGGEAFFEPEFNQRGGVSGHLKIDARRLKFGKQPRSRFFGLRVLHDRKFKNEETAGDGSGLSNEGLWVFKVMENADAKGYVRHLHGVVFHVSEVND